MVRFIANWIVNGLALYIVSQIVTGIYLEGFGAALLAAAVIGLVNALVKPILILATLPINFVTLGLFTFVVNAVMLLLASALTPGFRIDGFGTALLGAVLLSLISSILHSFVS